MIKSKKGQATVEMVILFALITSIWLGVNKILKNSQVYQSIFGDPWVRLKNTIEFGVPTDSAQAGGKHPAHIVRHSTRKK
ncbi:MAG: hypothetical protein IPM57_03470 [Oligoflexia bacterium]|nr:hypothetical protein [Oligoflexia bacterium]